MPDYPAVFQRGQANALALQAQRLRNFEDTTLSPLRMAAAVDELSNLRVRNRLAEMSLSDAERARKDEADYRNAILQSLQPGAEGQPGTQPSPASPPGQPPRAPYGEGRGVFPAAPTNPAAPAAQPPQPGFDLGFASPRPNQPPQGTQAPQAGVAAPSTQARERVPSTWGEYAAQQDLRKQALDRIKQYGDTIKAVGGLARFKKLQPFFATIAPELAKLDLTGVQETEDGFVKPILKKDGTPSGQSLFYFTDPASGESKVELRQDPETKPHGQLDETSLAKFGKKFGELKLEQQEEIETLVYGKGTGTIADAVKQVTSGKKRYYAQLSPKERKEVDALVQRQAFNVQLGGEKGRAEAAGGAFANWTPEQKVQAFENFIVNNQRPIFAWRDTKSRNAFEQEYVQYLIDKGKTAEGVGEKRAYRTAQSTALKQNEGYRAAAERFVSVIDQNAELVRKLRKKYGINYGRLFNSAVNLTRQKITGSGDLAALQQVLMSLSNEVAKVESGSMGIAEVSTTQAEQWKKVHDYNLDANDLDKVLDTSKKLGEIRRSTLRSVTDSLRQELGQAETPPYNPPPVKEVPRKPGETTEQYLERLERGGQ